MMANFTKGFLFNFILFLSQLLSPASNEFPEENAKFSEFKIAKKDLPEESYGSDFKKSIR